MTTTIAYSSALILGAFHALEPGHGKSFIAAYLVGERLTLRHLITLTLSLLISHFLLLIVIAVLMRFVFAADITHQAEEILSWVGPILILGFGIYLLVAHRHSHEEHDLFHSHGHSHGHSHSHSHSHGSAEKKNGTLGKSIVVGAIGGFLPCPTVLAPVFLSGANNNFENAIFYILTFILGMGVALFLMITLFYVLKESLVKRIEKLSAKIHPHLASAVLITITGVIYLLLRIFAHHPHA